MDNKMTAEQALESIEYAGHCAEQSGLIDCPERIRDAIPVLRAALSAPRVPAGETVTFWVVYDATADKKYIKKNADTGALAMFDYEHEAEAVSASNAGTGYKQVTYIKPETAPNNPVAPDAQQVIADLRAEVEALRDALGFVKIAILEANDSGIIADTLWATPQETLVDYIDAARKREGG